MSKSLIGSLPIYAQHLAEQTGVQVVVKGKQAYTEGKTVVVPFTEDDLPLSFGYIAHEASHVRNSDMAVAKEASPKPFRMKLLNILEDIRIERLSMDQYPGTEDDIRYLNRKVLLDPFRIEEVAGAQPLHVIHNAILYGGYWKLQEPQLEVPAKAYLAALDALLGQELAEQVMDEAVKTLGCANTREVLDLVDAIIALLPSDSEQSEGEDGDESENKDEEKGGEAQDSEGEKPSESGESSEGEDESSDQASNQAGEGGSCGAAQSESQPGEAATTPTKGLREQALDATENDLQGLISEVGDAAAEILGSKAKSEYHPNPPAILAGRTHRRADEFSARRIRLGEEHSSGLRQILNGLLQAQVDCRVRLKRQGRRIDTSRIAMMKSGETRVFRTKARAERQSAAIQFLFDKSGSMSTAMEQAEAALFAVLRSLEGLPLVTTGAMSFPGNASHSDCCDLIKRSTERLGVAVEAGGFGAISGGGTPLAGALWPAAVEVLRAKGSKKILFVMTDGEPNAGTYEHCIEMVKRCEASGVHVIGLGFGKADRVILNRIFKKYVEVGSVGNLKTALFEVVREALTD